MRMERCSWQVMGGGDRQQLQGGNSAVQKSGANECSIKRTGGWVVRCSRSGGLGRYLPTGML